MKVSRIAVSGDAAVRAIRGGAEEEENGERETSSRHEEDDGGPVCARCDGEQGTSRASETVDLLCEYQLNVSAKPSEAEVPLTARCSGECFRNGARRTLHRKQKRLYDDMHARLNDLSRGVGSAGSARKDVGD